MPRHHMGLAVFVGAYLVGFTAYALSRDNDEFVFYALVMVVLIAGTVAVHRRSTFSTGVLWLLAFWGLLHMAGGNMPIAATLAVDWSPPSPGARTVLYNFRPLPWVPRYDQVVHAYGFFAATLASFQACRAAIFGLGPRHFRIGAGLALACFLMGMGLGAANEVVEFVATRFMATNVGGYVNTGWDLVSNMIGAAIASIGIWLCHRGPMRPVTPPP